MQRIAIQNEAGNIKAEILPDYGGMVAKLAVDGKDMLYLEENRLADSPVSAGGIPVLFPFAGRVKDDRYTLCGKEYFMPMHGLVKNRTFAVKRQSAHAVTVWVKEDEALYDRNYPFYHTLELEYRLHNDALELIARIENRSQQPLPHTLGFHPYFVATDRQALTLTHHMTVHYDYTREVDSPAPASIRLEQALDNVYCAPTRGEYTLVNAPDGYRVRCVTDEAFQSLVVYTGKSGSVCIEPWCGIPDSIHNGRLVQWIPPGGSQTYHVAFHLQSL
jgi:galactose mutarotase-like enzyme